MLRVQSGNRHFRLALHFLNADESWFNLYKAFESIRDGNQNEETMIANGWVTRSSLSPALGTPPTVTGQSATQHATPSWVSTLPGDP